MFQCAQCGECCKHLKNLPLAASLDRGDGICKHLNEANNLCKIYANRPLYCNVDKAYSILYRDRFSLEEYEQMNYAACKALRQKI